MNEQFEKFITPVRELNALTVENLEKLMNIQMKYVEDSANETSPAHAGGNGEGPA